MRVVYKEATWRVFYGSRAVLLAGLVSFWERSVYLFRLAKPALAYSDQILYSRPGEALRLSLERSAVIGLVVGFPYLVLQVAAFVRPGLLPHEWRRWLGFSLAVSLHWLVAVVFGVEVLLEQLRKVLVSMGELEADFGRGFRLRAEEYRPWALKYRLLPGLLAQAPLVFLVGLRGRRPSSNLRKVWLGVSLLLGGRLSPPDLGVQLGLTLPVVLYRELRVFFSRVGRAYGMLKLC